MKYKNTSKNRIFIMAGKMGNVKTLDIQPGEIIESEVELLDNNLKLIDSDLEEMKPKKTKTKNKQNKESE